MKCAFTEAKHNMLQGCNYWLILCYMAASIIFNNAQRPGVVRHMKISEFEHRECMEDKIVIRVLNHKTSASRGPANIVITTDLEEMISKYLKYIRRTITPQNNQLNENLFLTHTGGEFKKINEAIQLVAKRFDVSTPSPTVHRKVIASEGRKCLDESGMRSLASHMAHSEATSKRFYQFPSEDEAYEVHNTIKHLNSRRQCFSEKEDGFLLEEYPLSNDTTPTLEICKLIVKKYELNRIPKQLQDRWRTLKANLTKQSTIE